ncbi:hypothetical protein [Shewanella sp. 0m-4]
MSGRKVTDKLVIAIDDLTLAGFITIDKVYISIYDIALDENMT